MLWAIALNKFSPVNTPIVVGQAMLLAQQQAAQSAQYAAEAAQANIAQCHERITYDKLSRFVKL